MSDKETENTEAKAPRKFKDGVDRTSTVETVTLKKPHIHRRELKEPGSKIKVTSRQAKKLRDKGVAA